MRANWVRLAHLPRALLPRRQLLAGRVVPQRRNEQPVGPKLVGDCIARCLCDHFRHHCAVDARGALAAFVLLFAAYMFVDGVLSIISGVRAARRHERWGWLIFEGVLDFIAGAIAFLWPL